MFLEINFVFSFNKIVPECPNVSKCVAEVPHRDCWCECKPIWGTVWNSVYTYNDAAKAGDWYTTALKMGWF